MPREFNLKQAVQAGSKLRILLSGASSSGKTYTALRLATGIADVVGGDIIFIDTENKRALHYADDFKFQHMQFDEPFGSDDYVEALVSAIDQNPAVVIVDSMSHEHEGPGGMIDAHAKVVHRMSGGDYKKAERVQMLAWREPKAARRRLLNKLVRLDAHLILCFRAGTKAKPGKDANTGKSKIIDQGFTSIGGTEFVYEMDIGFLLMPGCNGAPTLKSDKPGEHISIKIPKQFRDLVKPGEQLTEAHGRILAEWAIAGSSFDDTALIAEGDAAAERGMDALKAFWGRLSKPEQARLEHRKENVWKPTAQQNSHPDQPHLSQDGQGGGGYASYPSESPPPQYDDDIFPGDR